MMQKTLRFQILILLFPFCIKAQEPFRDFQTWQNFEFEYSINKRWLGKLQLQTRLSENSTRFSYYYIDVGLMYRITRNLRLNADYVCVQKQRLDMSYSTRHQYNIYLNYRKKVRRFTFFDRLLTEGQFTDYATSKNGKQLGDIYLRNKFTIRYKLISKLTGYIADEIYYRFDGKYYETGFNRNRLSVGLLYKLTDLWLLETFYIFEDNFNSRRPSQNFILGFGVTKSFYQ